MTVTGRVAFQVLGGHGVTKEDIATFERRFGVRFPGSVTGPTDAIAWALSLLPWERSRGVLADWLGRGFGRAGMKAADDRRIDWVLACVRSEDAGRSVSEVVAVVEDVITTLARVRGIPLEVDDEGPRPASIESMSPDMRMWIASRAALEAVLVQSGGRLDGRDGTYLIQYALKWVTLLEEDVLRNRATDELIVRLMHATATWVGSWVGSWGQGSSS